MERSEVFTISLSIVIPTHNRCSLLREAIASVISQNLQSLEIIVCDDGSTDETTEVCNAFASACNPVILSRTVERRGAQVARNRGLAKSKGDAVLFMDSDDVLAENGLSPLIRLLSADPRMDYVYGTVIKTDEALQPLAGWPLIGGRFGSGPRQVAGYHWHTMGAVYRKSYLRRVGPWNEALIGSQDWEYQARVKLAGGHGEFVDTMVGYWRQHDLARVGTRRFRPDYVRSVMLATESILLRAREAGKCNAALERRLAAKLIVHALEFGANGYAKDRYECLSRAAACMTRNRILQIAVKTLRFTPSIADGRLWQLLVGRRLEASEFKSS